MRKKKSLCFIGFLLVLLVLVLYSNGMLPKQVYMVLSPLANMIFIGLGLPSWVAVVLMGIIGVKLLVEFVLRIYYQDKF